MSNEAKWSYAVLRSGFGDLWVGKIKLEPDEKSVFACFSDAIERAKELNDSIDNADELDETVEEDLEPLEGTMKKWIV